MGKRPSPELIQQASSILEAGHKLLQDSHNRTLVNRRALVNRLTVAKGYLVLLESCPNDIDCEERLRKALHDLQRIMHEGASMPRGI